MTASLLLLLAVIAAPATSEDLVVCFAEGDHLAIEPSIEMVPCVAPLQMDGGMGAFPIEPCTDTPLGPATLRASDSHSFVPSPFSVSSYVPIPRSAPDFPRFAGSHHRPNADLAALRTVVLVV